MSLKIALLLSVILQFITAVLALTLVKRTRTNIAWWLISTGFVLMAIRRLFELLEVINQETYTGTQLLNSWVGVLISIVMLLSLSFIKRIFNIQERFRQLKKQHESRVFASILRTEEEQRQHFSKELHDGLGPLLSSVKMAISSLRKKKQHQPETILLHTEHLIDESIQTVREISNHLSPHVLNNFGLIKAVKHFLNQLQGTTPKIELQTNLQNERFSTPLETVVFRVLGELITNTLKHAQANHVYIDINLYNDTLGITYIDDGKGCDLTENNKVKNGMGMMNMQSRIKSVGGKCHFFSQPDEGFRTQITITLNRHTRS